MCIRDSLKITELTGMAAYKVAVMTGDSTSAAITEGTAPTESEPSFAEVTFTPASVGTLAYVSKLIRKLSPLDYESKVNESARRSLRKKLTSAAVAAITASDLNDSFALSAAAAATTGSVLFDQNLLSNIILAYGEMCIRDRSARPSPVRSSRGWRASTGSCSTSSGSGLWRRTTRRTSCG